ncbi:MAG: hypothetical protein ACREPD_08685 [Stenotrophomonas sp.]|uniref:hypothetical protein n=1 Tax=Stenotrophomonas sp. TaxID=69392 RepID=UPI003D6C7F3B
MLTAWGLNVSQLMTDVKLAHWQMLATLLFGCGVAQFGAWLLWRHRMGLRALALGTGLYWMVQLIYYAGPGEVLVSLLLMAGSLAVGSLLLRQDQHGVLDRMLLGAALTVSVVAWLLPFAVHGPRTYVTVFGLIVLLRWKALARDARTVSHTLNEIGTAHPLLLTLLLVVTGFASMGLWLPSLNFDDNSVHLTVQSQLLRDGYYRMDIASLVWSLQPWFNNTWHAMAAMLLGAESRAAVNLIWLVLGVTGAYRLSIALGSGSRAALLAAAVYASHPMTAYYSTTLQVDGPAAVILLHLAAVLCTQGIERRSAWVPGALIGVMLALKMTNVVYVLLPCLYITWLAVRYRRPGWWGSVVLVALVTGCSSYFYATVLTGSPVFPLFNSIFQSPYFPPESFADDRWLAGIGPGILWEITFDTSRFMEAYPGALGVSLTALLGGSVLALVQPGRSRWLMLAALIPAAILFSQIQYVRYIFPSLVLLGVLATVALEGLLARRPAILVTTLVVLCGVNLALLPRPSWITNGGAWAALVADGRSQLPVLVRGATPHHALLDRMLDRNPNACVLNTDRRPFTARMSGRALSVAWYDQQMNRAVSWSEKDPQGGRWVEIIQALGVSHVVVPQPAVNPGLARALESLGAVREDQEQNLELWRLHAASGSGNATCDLRFFQSRDIARRLFQREAEPSTP